MIALYPTLFTDIFHMTIFWEVNKLSNPCRATPGPVRNWTWFRFTGSGSINLNLVKCNLYLVQAA